jgi:hypothetical protein
VWEIVSEVVGEFTHAAGEGFPPGFEYRWTSSDKRQVDRVSGPEYVQRVVESMREVIEQKVIMPSRPGEHLSTQSAAHAYHILIRAKEIHGF